VVEYISIQDDYAAYLELLQAGDRGTDAALITILENFAFIATDDLGRYGLQHAYALHPPGVGGKPPFIVPLPTGSAFRAAFTLDDGYPGIEMNVKHGVDIFIAGGHSRVPYSVAMVAAEAIVMPLCFLLARNPDLGGACHGVELNGWDPQALSVPGENAEVPSIIWQGAAVHTIFDCYYRWRAT
jgi:hypothetical protein